MSIIQSALRGRQRESRLVNIKHPKNRAAEQEQSYFFLMRIMNIADGAHDIKTRKSYAAIYKTLLAEHCEKYKVALN